MSKKFNSLTLGLFVILGVVAVCVAIYRGSQADESDSEQAGRNAADVSEIAVNERTELSKVKVPVELGKSNFDLGNQIFASRLLEIASEYRQYEQVDQNMRWSPFSCTYFPYPPKLPDGMGRLSKNKSIEGHGLKLYLLFVRKSESYRDEVAVAGKEGKAAPLGQVLVKEAWHPIKFDPLQDPPLDKKSLYAKSGEDTYFGGDKQGLFIMFKTTPDTPGTDQGWVYGTVSADGQAVTSVGRIARCMRCHQDAEYDRQFGLPPIAVLDH